METVNITTERPALEGVLGPLSDARDVAIRAELITLSADLEAAAEAVGFRIDGSDGALELAWYPSGQMSIGGSVSGSDNSGNLVTFGAELRPSWFYGKRSDVLTWDVETTIEVDCRHAADHGGMDEVNAESTAADSAESAVDALRRSVHLIIRRMSDDLEQWTQLGSDGFEI